MHTKTDPFTRTPGVAGKAYIDNGVAPEVVQNFCNEESAKYVYKITGIRGSGKSVAYGNIIRTLKGKKDWLVYPLSASGDAVKTLIAKMSMEKFIDAHKKTTSVSSNTSIGGSIKLINGNENVSISKAFTENDNYYSDEATLVKMITEANKKKYKILIGIDDIAKTPAMVNLLSIIGSMLLEGLSVYLVVTGLSENIETFSSEKNLSFFKRADTIEIKSLNKYDVTAMYEKLLDISTEEAKTLEKVTMGYAYAYQVLGSLYFKKNKNETLSDLIPDFERILFKDSYDLVWKSLSASEKALLKCICRTKDGKVSDIKALMEKEKNFPVLRERLNNKHIVNVENRGYLTIKLPRFDKFIEIWGDD